MSRVTRSLLALALFASAFTARADALRLAAPAAGSTLRGGSFAEVRWTANALPPSAEEWEAFLSVDGGKYYAFRVTPHLDIDQQRFTFVVPNVDTRDARIMIRAGDEVHELHFESASSFSIVRDPDAEEVVPRLLHFGKPEAARDGDPAVVSWADGDRNGSGLTQQAAIASTSCSIARLIEVHRDSSPALASAANVAAAPFIASITPSVRAKHTPRDESRPVVLDLLLVCRRRNI